MNAILALIPGLLAQIAPAGAASATSGILALLSQVAPSLTTSGIGTAIKIIGGLLPPAINLVKRDYPIIKSIIADLKANKAITAAQMDECDALSAQSDAHADAAIAKAEAEDAAIK